MRNMKLKESKAVLKVVDGDRGYFIGKKRYSGITRMISKKLFPEMYQGVPQHILDSAAKRGTTIHKEIEHYIKTGEFGFTEELELFINTFEVKGDYYSEFMVNDNNFATSLDLVEVVDNEITIYDIKTTYKLEYDYLSWQLSIGAYLFEKTTKEKVENLKCIWIKHGKCEIIEIPRKTNEEVEELMRCFLEEEEYELSAPLDKNLMQEIEIVENSLKELLARKEELDKQSRELKSLLLKEMEKQGIKSWENDNMKITRIFAGERRTIDSKRLREEKPEIAEEYTKVSKTKASVRITLKEIEK